MGAVNGDGSPIPAEQMGLDTQAWYSTGFGGSDSGNTAAATFGATVGTPVVSVPGASSQVPESMPRLPVSSGQTGGMSDDQAIHPSALLPDGAGVTGIGQIRAPRSA